MDGEIVLYKYSFVVESGLALFAEIELRAFGIRGLLAHEGPVIDGNWDLSTFFRVAKFFVFRKRFQAGMTELVVNFLFIDLNLLFLGFSPTTILYLILNYEFWG